MKNYLAAFFVMSGNVPIYVKKLNNQFFSNSTLIKIEVKKNMVIVKAP